MVSQSDWLPMMMATGGLSVIIVAYYSSGDNVGDDLVFQLGQLVLDDEFLLLHPLDAKGIAARLDHGVDCGVVILMFLTQSRHDQPDFRLFLIGHAHFP